MPHIETVFEVFCFLRGYVTIFELKIFPTCEFSAFRDFGKKNDAKIRYARSGDAEKADFFLCSSKVYLNVLPKLILTTKLNRNALKSSFWIRSISWWCLLWWSTNIYLFLWLVNHLVCQKRVLHNQNLDGPFTETNNQKLW